MNPEPRYLLAGLGGLLLVYGVGALLVQRQRARPRAGGAPRSPVLAWAILAAGLALLVGSLFGGDVVALRPPVFRR